MSAGPDAAVADAAVSEPGREQAMSAARHPVGTGSSPLVALLVALALVALGVVGVQEALYRAEVVATSWTRTALDAVDDRSAESWLVPAGGLLVILGLLLLLVVVRRRPRKALALTSRTGVYLRNGDLARVVEDRVQDVPGAIDVAASGSRRKLHVRVTTIAPKADNASLTEEVRGRFVPVLDALDHPPRAKVAIRNEDLA